MKKMVVVLLAAVFGLALVTSVYAQKWDSAQEAEALAKGKQFKFAGEIVSVDPKGQTAMVMVKGKKYLGRFDYAKYEGAYKGVADLKAGDKIAGTGTQISGYNWITRVADQKDLPIPVKEGIKK